MVRSLRWRLQLWHAVVLTTVLIIFGGVVYALQWQTRLQQTDAELDRVALVLTSRLRGLFPVPRMPNPGQRQPRSNGRGGQPRTGDEGATSNANSAEGPRTAETPRVSEVGAQEPTSEVATTGNQPTEPADAALAVAAAVATSEEIKSVLPEASTPKSDQRNASRETPREQGRDSNRDSGRDASRGGPRDGRDSRTGGRDQSWPNPWFAPPPGLGLPDEFKHLFEGNNNASFYYIIWDQNGTVLANSRPVADIPFPNLRTDTDRLPVRQVRTREMQREVVHVSRFDINVLVGRSLQPDLAALHLSGLRLISTGLAVLLIGLAGGWWFSSRSMRPIAEMSATAESISIKNLSKRINVQSTATELEQLAVVLNRTFDRLQSAFERQSQFTADASHELRTPVSVILTHAELALTRRRTPEEYQAAFETCRRASLRMKSLIDSLLLLARFDSLEPELDLAPVDLDRLVQEAVDMLQPLAAERRVTMTCQTVPACVRADRERMFQVISNLLSNAIRYNRPDGRVDTSITVNEQQAIIRVADTGVGIPADDLPRIFDRFYRVDKARSQAEGGCGLGLSICQTIVDAHEGKISATSEPGVGTTIEVRLPIAKTAAVPPKSARDSQTVKSLNLQSAAR